MAKTNQSTVLVTGASGFVGGAVCNALAAAGRKVIGLCRDTEKAKRNIAGHGDSVSLVAWDMTQPLPWLEQVDAMIHAAGRGDPAAFAAAPAAVLRDTMLGCLHALEFAAANKVGRFLLISSGEAYGRVETDGRITETDHGIIEPHLPRSAYPLAKVATEGMALAYLREHGVPVCLARLCHMYGPGMTASDPRIAGQFPRTAARGEDIVLKSPGDQRRSWCHIRDAARGVLTILDRGIPGELYNIADEASELTVRQFAEKIAAAAGVRVGFDLPTKTERDIFNPMPLAVYDAGKLRALGWRAEENMDDALAMCITLLRST